MSSPRDRDETGRPRNARPRDATGRPLPRGAADAGREPETALPPPQALQRAAELLAAGLPFRAHEVLEAVWKAAPPADRALWRSLAQVAVGLTHDQRGNRAGARALLRRGADGLDGWCGAAGDRPSVPLVRQVVAVAREVAVRPGQPDGGSPSTRSSSAASNESRELAAIMRSLASSISASASSS